MIFPENISGNIKNAKELKNNIFCGDLTCCEQNDFKTYYTKNDYSDKICIAKCQKCLKEYEIYNSLTQGYDNCISSNKVKNYKVVNHLICKRCHANIYSIHLKFEYPPIDEMKQDNIEPISYAFSWIWISFQCSSCNKKYKNYINEETA